MFLRIIFWGASNLLLLLPDIEAEAAEGKGKCYLFVPDLVECREGALPEKAAARLLLH